MGYQCVLHIKTYKTILSVRQLMDRLYNYKINEIFVWIISWQYSHLSGYISWWAQEIQTFFVVHPRCLTRASVFHHREFIKLMDQTSFFKWPACYLPKLKSVSNTHQILIFIITHHGSHFPLLDARGQTKADLLDYSCCNETFTSFPIREDEPILYRSKHHPRSLSSIRRDIIPSTDILYFLCRMQQ